MKGIYRGKTLKELMVLGYLLATAFFIVGGFILEEAFRKPPPQQIVDGKLRPSSGRGSQVWLFYIGAVLIGIALVILFDIRI